MLNSPYLIIESAILLFTDGFNTPSGTKYHEISSAIWWRHLVKKGFEITEGLANMGTSIDN